jgi:tetratricopeptide (TPR) repeat protein
VRVFDAKISAPLVNRLLNDAGDNPDQLPILQHAMMRTWDYWQKHRGDSEQIDIKHYDNKEVGGMEHALSLHADEAYNELTEAQQLIAEKMFKRLTEKGTGSREGRLPAMLEEIKDITQAEIKDVTTVIEVFRTEGRSFLMPAAPRPLTPATLIDISHESLIRNWDRLRDWVEEEADSAKDFLRIRDDALRYSKRETGLLRNPALQFALDWRKKQQPNEVWVKRYSTLEGYKTDFKCAMDYLDESKEAHDRAEAQKERQRRKSLVILGTLAAVFLALFLITLGFYRSAEHAKANALSERKRADELRGFADERAEAARKAERSAKNAEAEALQSYKMAEKEREKAEEEGKKAGKAKETAVARAQEAERLRAIADAASERGELLENAIFLPINQGNTNEAIENFKKLQDDYARSGKHSKQAGVKILIGLTILSSPDIKASEALPYFHNALEMSQKDGTVNIDPSAFIKIGNSISKSPIAGVEAIPFYERAISLLRRDGPEKAELYLEIADIYLIRGLQNPNKAAEAFENAIGVYERIGDLNNVVDTLIRAGRGMYRKNNKAAAAEYFSQAIGIARRMKDPVEKGAALRDIAYGYQMLDLDRHVTALEFYNEAYKTYHDAAPQSPASSLGEGMALERIGRIYEERDKTEAIKYYERALKSYQQAGSRARAKELDVKARLEDLKNSSTGTQK